MSAWSTRNISKKFAEYLIKEVRAKKEDITKLTDSELKEELNNYAYSREHQDILGCLLTTI
jgi:preprotein translocase subunit SecA